MTGGGAEIDLRRLADGTLAYELPFAALDGERFERIQRGFAEHYDVERRSPDKFTFVRGEGYTRLERWDAFGYVDRGTVERVAAEPLPAEGEGKNVVILPAGYRALRFTLNMRVILVFYAAFLLVLRFVFLDDTSLLVWVAIFAVTYALHVALVKRSLSAKLKRWMARESWN